MFSGRETFSSSTVFGPFKIDSFLLIASSSRFKERKRRAEKRSSKAALFKKAKLLKNSELKVKHSINQIIKLFKVFGHWFQV